ncbi:MAG: hypothetical protein M3Z16_07710 [Pseudomonadota bacterium]|nr:hypothetical protein [Pseudomonadota bacterium]
MLALAIGWGLHWLGGRGTARSISIALVGLEPLLLVFWLWSTFGALASALRNVVGGPSRFWGVVTLLLLGIATVGWFAALRHEGAVMRGHWAVAMGKQPTERFDITVRDEGRTISFSGGVNDGAAAALDQAIGAAPKASTLLLDSPGGWLREGGRMADVVQRYRLNTRVEHECFSACTVVLLAGENRSAGGAAVIGFHRGRGVGESTDGRKVAESSEEFELYRRAGLKPEFVRRIVATPNDSIYIPSATELRRQDVLTR